MDKRINVSKGRVLGVENVFKMVGIDIYDTSKNRPWTPDGRDYLIELYRLGWTAEDMAEEMNRTPGSVIGEIYDLGEADKITPEMWGMDSKNKDFPKGPLGDISVVIPVMKRMVIT